MTGWMRSYGQALVLLLVAILVLSFAWWSPDHTMMYLTGVLLVIVAWVVSPLFFPRHHEFGPALQRATTTGRPLVMWRPGCMFCVRLRLRLGTRGRRVDWVNIWRSPEAAAYVRAVNDGNETVPTVVVGPVVRTNPEPSWVRARVLGG